MKQTCFLFLLVCALRAAAPSSGWQVLEPGLELGSFDCPQKSHAGNSRITVVRIDPSRYSLKLLCAGQIDSTNRTVGQWCRYYKLSAAINAGMYATDYSTHVGYLKNYGYVNNSRVRKDYKAVLAFGPVDRTVPEVQIIDMECQSFEKLRDKYQSLVQGIRMVSCRGRNVWSRQPEQWSIAALAMDSKGRVLFLFSESPYTVHDFINMVRALPIDIHNAMYLEGGGPAALYVSTATKTVERYGISESGNNAVHSVQVPRPLPNVIGIVKK